MTRKNTPDAGEVLSQTVIPYAKKCFLRRYIRESARERNRTSMGLPI